jgi:SNF2 family DNA or RNA helicase
MLSEDVASSLFLHVYHQFVTELFFSHQMQALFTELGKVMGKGDNIVIVSQFTSMLDLVHQHLKENHVKCLVLTGAVPVKERMALVDQFNGSSRSMVSV